MNSYKEFTTSKDCEQILGTLLDDEKLYMTLLSHLKKKLEEEVDSDTQRSNEILAYVSNPGTSIDMLNKGLKREFSILIKHYFDKGGQ